MKSILTKIPVIIGLILNIFCFVLFISVWYVGRGLGIALLGFSLLTAEASVILYFIDAILSIIKAVKKIQPIFNITLAIVIIIPVIVLICLKLLCIELFVAYYLVILLFEIISVIKHVKLMRDSKK